MKIQTKRKQNRSRNAQACSYMMQKHVNGFIMGCNLWLMEILENKELNLPSSLLPCPKRKPTFSFSHAQVKYSLCGEPLQNIKRESVIDI